MTLRGEPSAPSTSGPHLILYDGDCGFCNAWVRFVLARDPEGQFHFASLQGVAGTAQLHRVGITSTDLSTVYVIASYRSSSAGALAKSDAALFVLAGLGWPWAAARGLRAVPRPWRDAVYDLVAQHRHRLGSSSTTCMPATPEQRARFLDQ